jgi:uncharacterized protein (UPF0210 family)
MPLFKNTLTHHQYHQLCAYMESRAVKGRIDLKPGALAGEATAQLDFEVSADKARRTAREIGIKLISNTPRNNEKTVNDDDDDDLMHLKRIDHKLNLIIGHLNIDT